MPCPEGQEARAAGQEQTEIAPPNESGERGQDLDPDALFRVGVERCFEEGDCECSHAAAGREDPLDRGRAQREAEIRIGHRAGFEHRLLAASKKPPIPTRQVGEADPATGVAVEPPGSGAPVGMVDEEGPQGFDDGIDFLSALIIRGHLSAPSLPGPGVAGVGARLRCQQGAYHGRAVPRKNGRGCFVIGTRFAKMGGLGHRCPAEAEEDFLMWRLRVVFASFLILTGLCPVTAARAEDDAAERLYLHYCSSCHGKTGVGDGPLASLLQQRPTDLTRLAEASGGEISLLKLMRSIDGRRRVRAHGSSEMPVWGEVLGPRSGDSEAEQVRAAGKLLLLAYYVESLQRSD